MQVTIKFTDSTARSIEYYLRRRFSSKAKIEQLIKTAILKDIAIEAQRELDELNAKKL